MSVECNACCEVNQTVVVCEHPPCEWRMCPECFERYDSNQCPACRKPDFVTLEIKALPKNSSIVEGIVEGILLSCANGVLILLSITCGITGIIIFGYTMKCIAFNTFIPVSLSPMALYIDFSLGFLFLCVFFCCVRSLYIVCRIIIQCINSRRKRQILTRI